jgi:serine/threonine protein kinase
MHKLKLIDLGLARHNNEYVYTYMQSRYYRAPEVILELEGLTQAIDMWSVGCTLAEMYISLPLFPGSSPLDMLHKITRIMG